MDTKVLQVQQWLNQTYPLYFDSTSGTFPVSPDGITGGTTTKALVMALQVEVGATPVDGEMGSGSISKCPTIGKTSSKNLLSIIQGGLFCKGYNAGTFDGIYGSNTSNAINAFKKDAGFAAGDGTISPMFIKALLNTDPFVMVAGSSSNIRSVQQFLNVNYYGLFWTKLGLIPTGGKYERKTNKALIYAIQKEIGTTADGAIGTNTFKLLPVLNQNSPDSVQIKLLKCALICNGFDVTLDSKYNQELFEQIKKFQEFMHLIIDPMVILGSVNRRTWGALLISKGDVERTANACDCSTKLNASKAKDLFDAGFRYVGRYLTKVQGGLDKDITKDEINAILSNGLSIFPIFQENNSSIAHFSFDKGTSDAIKALNAAKNLKIPFNTVIYFAVDCDMTEDQIAAYAFPYFNAINMQFKSSKSPYRIGVYGSRNVCIQVSNANYAVFSFVGDMSSGYSGNLGYQLPNNWSFEQFNETASFPLSSGTMGLDYNIANGKDAGITNINYNSEYIPPYFPTEEDMKAAVPISNLIDNINLLERAYWNYSENFNYDTVKRTRMCCLGVLDYLFQYKYDDIKWEVTTPKQHAFLLWINSSAVLADLFTKYIVYNLSEDKETKPILISDNNYGLMELAHLAIGIKCYLDSTFPGPWSTWAGDLASAINETWVNAAQSTDLQLNSEIAFARIGASEPKTTTPIDTRQFNYYDIIADIDSYKIAELIELELKAVEMGDSTEKYVLSNVLHKYYGTQSLYKKRFEYCLNEQKYNSTNIPNTIELSYQLIQYMTASDQALLASMFCDKAIQNSAALFSTCAAYSNFILYMYAHKN